MDINKAREALNTFRTQFPDIANVWIAGKNARDLIDEVQDSYVSASVEIRALKAKLTLAEREVAELKQELEDQHLEACAHVSRMEAYSDN